ncbi:tRNA pseudouridine(13) synthase TruD [Candidatus Woesearchaeota archaeon]|nr:tRNA pseudouridine(13) synthase TruD [Candidatus Woesearchaeota archaeon]
MYQIKALPEDFIVKEIMDLEIGNGQYAYFLLNKANYNTVSALELLSKKFKMPLKDFGFAGNKDRNALTEQHISIFSGSRSFENISINGLSLKYLSNGKSRIYLGAHSGNEFSITVRNLEEKEIHKIKSLADAGKIIVPNYFGRQRFGRNNHNIGRLIVKGDFRKAASLMAESSIQSVSSYLSKSQNDFVGAITTVPLKTRRLFVHSYQSFLFNKTLFLFLKSVNGNEYSLNLKIPLIGFGFDIDEIENPGLREALSSVIAEEFIAPRDFIIRPMPELSSEGASRGAFFEMNNFSILEESSDELNNGMKKLKLKFFLEKGCFATTALDFILNDCSDIVDNIA